ncbi:hypothetical protein BDV39DRAFT_193408 [Aspergillus sergii]|uniref:Uncharacterized protein n=1 Tax=Aspergillus sergii TaxID=1034303 RepID=A0A5N6X036_9EURO|nr:hypothetical protein BDV39DRAFT_193408 [Aspergillus sergii]
MGLIGLSDDPFSPEQRARESRRRGNFHEANESIEEDSYDTTLFFFCLSHSLISISSPIGGSTSSDIAAPAVDLSVTARLGMGRDCIAWFCISSSQTYHSLVT